MITSHRDGDEPLHIAMIGQRGLPPTYGGIEHHVAHLGRRLVARGHQVTVFCRTNYVPERLPSFDGVRLRHLPTLGTKHLDAIVHSVLSTLAAMGERPHILHYHALGPGLCAPLPRYLSGARVVQTVHGHDDRGPKWGSGARSVLRLARWMSERVPHAVVAVSKLSAEEYGKARPGATAYIPNGVEPPGPRPATSLVQDLGLRPGRYVLFVGRLIPDKAVDVLIKAFRALPHDMDLAIVGGSAFTGDHVSSLHALAAGDKRVRMIGYAYGERLEALYAHAAAYVQPSWTEGMPLTVLEAMSHGLPVVLSEIRGHLDLLTANATFPAGDVEALSKRLAHVLDNLAAERSMAEWRREGLFREHSWDVAAARHETLYRSLVAARR
ncbi:glycosyltransferase family 4 protein [Nonomuraea endophytica]|uniref:glycosyltransferase family 4 protein n=1 Tax=Nonomuraea endophytica TaxID=714136 RepID=UPI0037C85E44